MQLSGYNARRTVFGGLQLRTGRMLCLQQQRKRAEEFQQFLELLRWHYRKGPLALLLDENSSHTAKASQALAEALDIRLLWLPQRSPHLNPMDHLWRHGKEAICSNYQHATIGIQVAHFLEYYESLSPADRLRKAGMLSPDFWLYHVCH